MSRDESVSIGRNRVKLPQNELYRLFVQHFSAVSKAYTEAKADRIITMNSSLAEADHFWKSLIRLGKMLQTKKEKQAIR